MLVLFDQGTPVPLRPFLTGHIVRTAAQQGWDRLENGDLLNAAEAGRFEVLLTTDRNIRYQQTSRAGASRLSCLASRSGRFRRSAFSEWSRR
jgi:hypothetical protein